MTDGQLYLLNIADKRVTPLTKDFNPSVQRAVWNKAERAKYISRPRTVTVTVCTG